LFAHDDSVNNKCFTDITSKLSVNKLNRLIDVQKSLDAYAQKVRNFATIVKDNQGHLING